MTIGALTLQHFHIMLVSFLIFTLALLAKRYPIVKALPWILVFLLIPISTARAQKQVRFAFYNVENLMDTLDNPHKNDNDFLPGSKNNWNAQKYLHKLNQLAAAIEWLEKPAGLGLAEVENRGVVEALMSAAHMQNYAVVHFESPDERGIDVALMVDTTILTLQSARKIPVFLPGEDNTRDILRVQLDRSGCETSQMVVYVCHFPSRRGGDSSMVKRLAAVDVLSADIIALNDRTAVLVMGDFNDNPHDPSIQRLELSAGLFNLTDTSSVQGSLVYQHQWFTFDQILFSEQVRFGNWDTGGNGTVLFNDRRLSYFDEKRGRFYPNRTFNQGKYYGGFSDHYPVYIDLLLHGCAP